MSKVHNLVHLLKESLPCFLVFLFKTPTLLDYKSFMKTLFAGIYSKFSNGPDIFQIRYTECPCKIVLLTGLRIRFMPSKLYKSSDRLPTKGTKYPSLAFASSLYAMFIYKIPIIANLKCFVNVNWTLIVKLFLLCCQNTMSLYIFKKKKLFLNVQTSMHSIVRNVSRDPRSQICRCSLQIALLWAPAPMGISSIVTLQSHDL